jgi:hypothetical protein
MVEHPASLRNDAAKWSDFDADDYWEHNYATVLPEDAEIIETASKFLIAACETPRRFKAAVDVGAGTNLYPGLLMLPWVERITFTEFAADNIRWLSENLSDATGEWRWQRFWDLVAHQPGYQDIDQPRGKLTAVHEVRTLSIFDLPKRTWDLGSMFFVADGLTEDEAEYETAVRSFLGALVPGSPFFMAFMENSTGYNVHGVPYPSVRVTPSSLDDLLSRLPVTGHSVLRTDNSIQRLRDGYDAMLLVTGWVTA